MPTEKMFNHKKRSGFFRCTLLVFVVGLQGGCASWIGSDEANLAKDGPEPIFDSESLETYKEDQNKAYDTFEEIVRKRGNANPSADDVISAGMQYADARCSEYLESLYWVDKQLKADIKDANAAGTLASGVLGATKAAAKEIASVAVLFGYREDVLNNAGSRVLFDLDPSTIQSLVERSQKVFRERLKSGYKKADALSVIREYDTLCSSSRIEAEVNDTMKKVDLVATEGDVEKGEPPKVSVDDPRIHTYGSDINSLLLESYAFPGNEKNDAAHKALKEWMEKEGIDIPVAVFLMSSEHKPKWEKAVDYLYKHGNPKLKVIPN